MEPLHAYHYALYWHVTLPALFAVAFLTVLIKRKGITSAAGAHQFWMALVGSALATTYFSVEAYVRHDGEKARVEISENGISCEPWGFKPWMYFSEMSLRSPGLRGYSIGRRDLILTLDKQHIHQDDWPLEIANRGTAMCILDNLDAPPEDIFNEAYVAWSKKRQKPSESVPLSVR